jgi:hypothetical protein
MGGGNYCQQSRAIHSELNGAGTGLSRWRYHGRRGVSLTVNLWLMRYRDVRSDVVIDSPPPGYFDRTKRLRVRPNLNKFVA